MATTFSRYCNGPMDRYELRHIMWTWPILMRQATDPLVLSFASKMWERRFNPNWLKTLRQKRVGPSFIKLERKYYYRVATIEDWFLKLETEVDHVK